MGWNKIREIAYTKKSNRTLPILMPWVWHIILMVAFVLGIIAGIWLAYYTLGLRSGVC